MAVDTLGHLLALHVIPANEQDRAQLAEQEQDVTDTSVELASVDQGGTGARARQDAADHRMQLEVVKRTQAKKGFVRLPRGWVVERSFGRAARFRRLARDDERLRRMLAGLHLLAFAILVLTRFVALMVQSAQHALAICKLNQISGDEWFCNREHMTSPPYHQYYLRSK